MRYTIAGVLGARFFQGFNPAKDMQAMSFLYAWKRA